MQFRPFIIATLGTELILEILLVNHKSYVSLDNCAMAILTQSLYIKLVINMIYKFKKSLMFICTSLYRPWFINYLSQPETSILKD